MITEQAADFLADFATTATKNGTVAVSGVFDKAYGEAYGMIAGTDPVFRCPGPRRLCCAACAVYLPANEL